MQDDLQQRIHSAAIDAWNDVWETRGSCEEPSAALTGVAARADEAYRRTVEQQCRQVGAGERDYWLALPEQALIYRPACVADRLEQIAADLRVEDQQRGLEFFHNHPPF